MAVFVVVGIAPLDAEPLERVRERPMMSADSLAKK
jgi:hypothetical protein